MLSTKIVQKVQKNNNMFHSRIATLDKNTLIMIMDVKMFFVSMVEHPCSFVSIFTREQSASTSFCKYFREWMNIFHGSW